MEKDLTHVIIEKKRNGYLLKFGEEGEEYVAEKLGEVNDILIQKFAVEPAIRAREKEYENQK